MAFLSAYGSSAISLYNPDVEIRYSHDGYNELTVSGIITNNPATTRKHDVYPGSITLADANGRTIEMQPTGTGGYTLHAPEPVRINSKMNEALREHAARCLSYVKPRPPAELEA